MNAKSTKQAETKNMDRDTLRPEYRRGDLGKGERGKYHTEFQAGTNLVLLAPDVAQVFETPQAVNDALRSLISVAERSTRTRPAPTRRPSPRPRKSG